MLELTAVVCSLVVLSVISIILNSFSIYIIKTSTKFREKPSSILVMNLLLIHMFQAVFVFPLYTGKKLNNDAAWKQFFSSGFLFTYMLSFYGACFSVLSISLDRFLATYLLTRYKTYATFKNIMCVIALAWVYVLLLCLIPFVPESKSQNDWTSIESSNRTVTPKLVHDSVTSHVVIETSSDNRIDYNVFEDLADKGNGVMFVSYLVDAISTATPAATNVPILAPRWKFAKPYNYTPQKGWTVFMLIFNAAIPLGIIVACYVYIIYRLKQLDTLHAKKDKELDRYKKVTYLTLVLTATYTVCWSPSIIYYTILNVCEHTCFNANWDNSFAEKHIVYIIKFLSFMNAMCSPIIYCFHQQPEVEKRFSKLRHLFSRSTKVTPLGNIDGYKVAIKEAKLDDITVAVYQTYNTTPNTNLVNNGECEASSYMEAAEEAMK